MIFLRYLLVVLVLLLLKQPEVDGAGRSGGRWTTSTSTPRGLPYDRQRSNWFQTSRGQLPPNNPPAPHWQLPRNNPPAPSWQLPTNNPQARYWQLPRNNPATPSWQSPPNNYQAPRGQRPPNNPQAPHGYSEPHGQQMPYGQQVPKFCLLSLRTDYRTPSPVYLSGGSYLTPSARNGMFRLWSTESITVSCPGQNNYVIIDGRDTDTSIKDIEVHCLERKTFYTNNWVGELKSLSCHENPTAVSEETSVGCFDGNIFRIGYYVKRNFYQLYEACFNKIKLQTHYVKHFITPERIFFQNGFVRPRYFEQGTNFGRVNMNSLYYVGNQHRRFDEILGANMSLNYIKDGVETLTRGHLAASSDFSMIAQRLATFQYINTSPQWNSSNLGAWEDLERCLRNYIHQSNMDVTVYTGSYGILQLPNHENNTMEIYMGTDASKKGIVPVPLYFYKVVYEPKGQLATAFISINAPFFDEETAKSLTFCTDICKNDQRFSWLSWWNDNSSLIFCCAYPDFAKKVNYLPMGGVNGVLY